MKNTILTIASLSLLLFSCNSEQETKTNKITEVPEVQFENKGHKLVYNMVQKVGNYKSLTDKKNVSYTYRYTTADNQSDISTERYIFNGELSYGNYKKHERTLSQFEGAIEQGYDGSEFWLKHNGEIVEDAETLKRVKFNRPTNFYWFTMMQ